MKHPLHVIRAQGRQKCPLCRKWISSCPLWTKPSEITAGRPLLTTSRRQLQPPYRRSAINPSHQLHKLQAWVHCNSIVFACRAEPFRLFMIVVSFGAVTKGHTHLFAPQIPQVWVLDLGPSGQSDSLTYWHFATPGIPCRLIRALGSQKLRRGSSSGGWT